MRKSSLTEAQIVEILKEGEAGVPVAERLRKQGISRATYINWRTKYGGASVADLVQLKELEAENAKLKHPDPERDTPVITALQAVVSGSSCWGCLKCYDRLRPEPAVDAAGGRQRA